MRISRCQDMINLQRARFRQTHATPLLLAIAWTVASSAQDPSSEPVGAVSQLRAEMTVGRSLFQPSQPILVRFTLFNPTDEAIELPLPEAPDEQDGITLPRGLIIGSPDQPALYIAYENERPVAIRPEPREQDQGRPGLLRLAPRASLGAEFDLRSAHRVARYSGNYQLEWQPLGDQIAPPVISFRVEPRKDAVLVTDYGKITFSLMYGQAPRNVENFLELVRERFYDGKAIHRVVPGFIVQGGSPDGSRSGVRPDGKLVPGEFHDTPFVRGTLAMARKPNDRDSASCQFFISLARLPELDGKYTVIGQANDEESLRTLQLIEQLPVNAEDRPIRPLAIRFFTLVDASAGEIRQLESSRP